MQFTGYAVPPVVAIVIFAILIIYFTRLRIHYSAFLYAFLFLLWSLGEFVERIASPPYESEIALVGLRIIAIAGAFLPAALVHFACEFPVRCKLLAKPLIGFLYILSTIIAFICAGTDILISGLIVYAPGWGAKYGMGMLLWGTYIIAGTLICIAMLEKRSFELASKVGRSQARMIAIALGISLCCAAITGYVPTILGIQDVYPLTTIPFAITGLLMLHSFLLYAKAMHGGGKRSEKEVEPGYFWSADKEIARKYFLAEARSTGGALFVTSEMENREIESIAKVIVVAKNGDINPMEEERISMLPFLVEKFVAEEGKLVLIEVFDELLAHYFYSTISVPQMLEEIKRCAQRYNARIICSFELEILEDWQIEEMKKGGKELSS